MIFPDDEARHIFHKSPVLLQVACQIFEAHLAAAGTQASLVDCEKQAGMHIAIIALEEILHEDSLADVIAKTNQAMQRTDEIETCQLESAEAGLVSLRITDSADLSQLN